MPEIRTLRQRFRNGILSEAEAAMDRRLGQVRGAVRIVDFVLGIGARGAALDGTEHTYPVRLGLNGTATILTWSMTAMAAGLPVAATVSVDILAGSTLSGAVSICAGHLPSLVAQSELADQPPTGWTITLADPSTVLLLAHSVDGIAEVVSLTLRLAVGGAPTTQFVDDSSGNILVDNSGNPVTWGP